MILSLVVGFLAGCSEWGVGLPEGVLAKVNGESIMAYDFDREFKELVLEPGRGPKGKDLESLKQAYLDQVIERKILVQEAKQLGFRILPAELNRAIADIRKDYSEEGFGERLGLKGMTLEEWKALLEERLLSEKMIRRAVPYDPQVDEKTAQAYYESHRSSFQLPQRVRARQIVVADGEEAIQILKRLKKGEGFEKLAMEKSLGPEKVRGGDLGYFSRGERPPEFDGVFDLEVKALSDVIKSPYGYHIFRVEEKTGPREVPFEEAKARIFQEVAEKKREEDYRNWLKELKEKAKIVVSKKLLRA